MERPSVSICDMLSALKDHEYMLFKKIENMVIADKVSDLVTCTDCKPNIACHRNFCRGRYLNTDGTWKTDKRHLNTDGTWKIDELNRIFQFHSPSSIIGKKEECRNIKLGPLENFKYTYIKEF